MSGPNSPVLPNDMTYRFISDPAHKENLSGRVRAACMTCRRKKIKCSGEINCQTCREKGLVCEGLPERKRPRRDGGSALLDSSSISGIERKRKLSPTKKTSAKRPSLSALQQSLPMTSQDSGYVSTQPKTRDTKRSLKVSTSNESFLAIDIASDGKTAPGSTNATPGLRIDTWRLNAEPARPSSTSTTFDITRGRSPSEVSPGAEPPSAILQSPPMDWPQAKDEDSWWTGKPVPNASELMSTTRVLQDQAETLRHMANRPPDNVPAFDASLRRQTIAFPLPSDGNEFRYDLLQNQYGIFDDMALLLSNRTPGTGMTPGLQDFSSWWDLSSGDLPTADLNAGDLMSLFTPGQTSQSMAIGQDALTAFDETPTSQAGQSLSRQQASQAGYFDQVWPE